MTADFMAVPQNLEAEQSVIGGLLLDDDNSERVQKADVPRQQASRWSDIVRRARR